MTLCVRSLSLPPQAGNSVPATCCHTRIILIRSGLRDISVLVRLCGEVPATGSAMTVHNTPVCQEDRIERGNSPEQIV